MKSTEQIGRELCEIKKIIETLQEQFDEGKKELLEKGIKETMYYPDLDMKVSLSEGRQSSDYDVMKVYADMIAEGIMEEFPKIVKINKSQVDTITDISRKNMTHSILLKNAVVSVGSPSISVGKMTLKEKKEIQ